MTNIQLIERYKTAVDNSVDISSKMFGLEHGEIYHKSRSNRTAHARFVAYYILNKYYRVTISDIARLFNKDHSSIINGVDKVVDNSWVELIERHLGQKFSTYPQD